MVDTSKIADNYAPWSVKDPWIKTNMDVQISRINLLKELCVDKKLNVMMFCPKCVAFRTFNKIPYIDMYTGEEPVIYECNDCKKKFVEHAWNPNNDIEKLITINDLIAPYQKDIQLMEMRDFDGLL